jgi:hypothetical protein
MEMVSPDAEGAGPVRGTWRRRALNALAVSAFLGGAVTFGLLPCPVALLARVPCPGCGMTRATLALFRGDVSTALHFHPLVFVILPTLGLFFGTNLLMYVLRGEWGWVDGKMGKGISAVAALFLALTVAVWVSRFFGAFGGPVPV